MTIKRTLASAVAGGAILLYAIVPAAFAETSLDITGNGSSSENSVNVTANQSTDVTQTNDAHITNTVTTTSTTGGNKASDNTGGSTDINTGSASSTVDIVNAANLNNASVDECNTCNGDVTVKISGNGSDSVNDVSLDNSSTTDVSQSNFAAIKNKVDVQADSGNNQANRNTGGDVTVTTGNALTDVSIANLANANVAKVGDDDSDGSGTVSAQISGNGSSSENSIDLLNTSSIALTQLNDAHFGNHVDADASTGWNKANDNTSGNTSITTGDASAKVSIDNMANFNMADVECCLVDVSGSISGNGSRSDNYINADFSRDLSVFQGERDDIVDLAAFHNRVNVADTTGDNKVNRNTGIAEDDGAVSTGDATDDVSIKNASNANIFGSDDSFELPSGDSLSLLFDLTGLLGLFGLS